MTAAQARVWWAVVDLTAERGIPPTIREVADRAHLKSSSTVAVHLAELRRQRRVDWMDGAVRTLIAIDEQGRRA